MKNEDVTRREFLEQSTLTAVQMNQLRVQVVPTKAQLERFFYHHYESSRV